MSTLVWIIGRESYHAHHRFIAGALGSITSIRHRNPNSEPPPGVWWRDWWDAHEAEYPEQYRPIEPTTRP